MFRSGYSAMSQSPALGSFTRKTEEETPEALSERMQYMIDMQNAYTQSIPGSNEEDEDGTGEASSEQQQQQQQQQPTMINQPRAILPSTYPDPSSLPVNNPPDPTVGKGQIIFPSSYQLSDGAMLHHGGEDGLLQDQFVVHEKSSNYPDYLSDPQPPDPEPCCCLWQPLVSCCTALLWEAENLHRSFCYGAIDGMLTGAGLVATLSGFGFAMEAWMVAVTLCACTADALCMALGHVWSTHVLSSHAANDRRTERVSFEANRHESKAKLVDMLLSRGMLKIDAMSIADTLEGYPDIFVGALVGDAVVLPNSNQEDDDAAADPTYGLLSNTHGSYGKFNEMRHDPDAAAVKVAVAESRTEGFIMMISFALFGTLPAIIYHTVNSMSNPAAAATAAVMSGMTDDGGLDGGGADPAISPRSAAITITCIIMWFLGVWKSQFFDSNWILFGIETVVVLMVCVLTAYALGSGLSHLVHIPGVQELSNGITDDDL